MRRVTARCLKYKFVERTRNDWRYSCEESSPSRRAVALYGSQTFIHSFTSALCSRSAHQLYVWTMLPIINHAYNVLPSVPKLGGSYVLKLGMLAGGLVFGEGKLQFCDRQIAIMYMYTLKNVCIFCINIFHFRWIIILHAQKMRKTPRNLLMRFSVCVKKLQFKKDSDRDATGLGFLSRITDNPTRSGLWVFWNNG